MKFNLTQCAINVALLGSMATAFAADRVGTSAPLSPRGLAPTSNTAILPTQPLQLSPPDLAMTALTSSKATVNRMEPFQLDYTIKNVGKKDVTNAAIRFTADYYPLSAGVDIGPLKAGEEKSGTSNITVMTDSMMNMGPEPYPVHINFKATARVIGPNNSAVPDLNPANDEKTVMVTAKPG